MHIKNYKPRFWQDEAAGKVEPAFMEDGFAMLEACPGAGKTYFALSMAVEMLRNAARPFLAIVVPSDGLRSQWVYHAGSFGLNLIADYDFSSPLPKDCHGIVHTYHTITNNARYMRHMFRYGGMVVFDEIHHCTERQGVWGPALIDAFGNIDHPGFYVLSLTGTPFRTDNGKIPFVKYLPDPDEDGSYLCSPDYSYSYGKALDDTFKLYDEGNYDAGVVRPIYFPNYDGVVEYMHKGESYVVKPGEYYIEDNSHAYMAKISADSEIMVSMLRDANSELSKIRREGHANAGGLIVAVDKDHARNLADRMQEIDGERPTVVHSDIENASEIIESFNNTDKKWIIAVKMIAEGVDIKRLRVGVYASNIKTPMWLIQVIGRVLRWQPGLGANNQLSYFFFVDDPDFKPIIDNYRACVEAVALDAGEIEDDMADWPASGGDGSDVPIVTPGDNSIILQGSELTGKIYIYDGRRYTNRQHEHAEKFKEENGIQASIPEILKMMGIMGTLPEEDGGEVAVQEPPNVNYARRRKRMRTDASKLMKRLSVLMWKTHDGQRVILSLFPSAIEEPEGRFRAMYKLYRKETGAPYVPAKQMSIEELEDLTRWAQKKLNGISNG